MSYLADRVDDVRLWATQRIKVCLEVEDRFFPIWKHLNDPTFVKANTERRALQTVLRMLDGEPES